MSLLPLGGFQLPFQKRLSRLYNDTKKSSDFVKEPVQAAEDPEVKALHRKLRIQKDRLVTWGVEWSDPNQSAEIDESLSKAGLSEVVGSVMSTIKDILAEAEPLWQSYKGETSGPATGASKGGKGPVRVWDRGRFEDLVRDLTVSIDTLYDLSRTRSTAMATAFRGAGTSAKQSDEAKIFESTRMETPHQIDPSTLTHLSSTPTDAPLDVSQTYGRSIVFMSKAAFSDLTPDPWAPLLLEFASFDSIYSTTGIMPPMSRFERLSAGLQRGPQRSPGTWTGLPRLLGYFEDMERSRLGLVYQFPPAFSPVSFQPQTKRATGHFVTLRELLARPDYEPRLEAKFRMAHNLANTVFDMHTRGVTHGNLVDGSVAFCTAMPEGSQYGEPDVRRPLVTSFDLFPDTPSEQSSASQHPLFHHPLDPYVTQVSPLAGQSDLRFLDLYSLAMILLSIGMWTSVDNLVPDARNASSVPESVLDKLAIRCGTLYMKAVETCWNAVEEELSGRRTGEEVLVGVQAHVSRCLEACCIIDGVSGFAERAGEEPQPLEAFSGSAGDAFKIPGAFGDEEEEAEMDKALAVLEKEERVSSVSLFKMEVPDPGTQDLAAEAVDTRAMPKLRRAARETRDSQSEHQLLGDSPVESLASRKAPAPWMKPQEAKLAMPQVSRQVAKRSKPARVDSAPVPSPRPEEHHPKTPDVPVITRANSGPAPIKAPRERSELEIKTREHPPLAEPKREKLRLYPQVPLPPEAIEKWNKVLMPSINSALRQFYRKNPESVEISLEAIGPSPQTTKPTVLVVCTSVGKVKSILHRKMSDLFDGTSEFGVKVCRGRVVRSRGDSPPANAEFQERPQGGASIGAWVGYDHLPPVSFGGLVVVDDRAYGMTVHHMLDDPEFAEPPAAPLRSAAYEYSTGDSESEEYSCEFSDEEDEDEYSDTELTSDEEEDEEDEEFAEPGDIPGVEPGCGDGYVITQPAFDDVDEGFYPVADSAAEDHVDSFALGTMYASSGIRRREENGLVHEVDWALFEFRGERMPGGNCVPRVGRGQERGKGKGKGKGKHVLCPTSVASTDSLPGLEVQCVARTSGAQTGRIHPSLTSVKIYGRVTPSHTYQVTGEGDRRLGVPGDSGAWLVDGKGRVCGHVLAWSQRKRAAYMCPMDVLLLDIADVLGAEEVRLPDGQAEAETMAAEDEGVEGLVEGVEALGMGWEGEVRRSRARGAEGKGDVGVGIAYLSEKVEGKGCPVVCVDGYGGGFV